MIAIMKKLLFVSLCLLACLSVNANTKHSVELANGLSVSVEVCSNTIFRVQVSPDGQFPEALLNRYGIVKTDWPGVGEKVSEEGGVFSVSTSSASISIDKASGTICLKDANGKTVVREIVFHKGGSDEVMALAEAVIDKFGGLVVAKNDGIIGDDNNAKNKRDVAEAGDPGSLGQFLFKPWQTGDRYACADREDGAVILSRSKIL